MSKKPIQVTLHMSEITYDIMNSTYLKGVRMDDGSNYEAVYNAQIDDRDENKNNMLRSISAAWANLSLSMRRYLNMPSYEADNILIDDHGEITVNLMMPSNYNLSNTTALAAMLHQYIVNYAVGEWYAISNRDEAAGYYTEASAYMSRIQSAMNDRVPPMARVRCE